MLSLTPAVSNRAAGAGRTMGRSEYISMLCGMVSLSEGAGSGASLRRRFFSFCFRLKCQSVSVSVRSVICPSESSTG